MGLAGARPSDPFETVPIEHALLNSMAVGGVFGVKNVLQCNINDKMGRIRRFMCNKMCNTCATNRADVLHVMREA